MVAGEVSSYCFSHGRSIKDVRVVAQMVALLVILLNSLLIYHDVAMLQQSTEKQLTTSWAAPVINSRKPKTKWTSTATKEQKARNQLTKLGSSCNK
jgi:hypothetical protein